MERPWLDIIKHKKGLVGCEIGVKDGRHAQLILETLDISKLYLIDTWDSFPTYTKRYVRSKKGLSFINCKSKLSKWRDKTVFINDFSENAHRLIQDGTLDFVYVDANHENVYVKKDIELYWPKLKAGGLMAGHDYIEKWQGVIDAVTEFFGNNFEISNTGEKKFNREWWSCND